VALLKIIGKIGREHPVALRHTLDFFYPLAARAIDPGKVDAV
jgi:hypothetical protein